MNSPLDEITVTYVPYVTMQDKVDTFYSQLTASERLYFKKEGIEPKVLLDQSGPWLEQRVKEEVGVLFGDNSIAIKFLYAVFGLSFDKTSSSSTIVLGTEPHPTLLSTERTGYVVQ